MDCVFNFTRLSECDLLLMMSISLLLIISVKFTEHNSAVFIELIWELFSFKYSTLYMQLCTEETCKNDNDVMHIVAT